MKCIYDVVVEEYFLCHIEKSRRTFDTYIHAYDTCLNMMKKSEDRWYSTGVSNPEGLLDKSAIVRSWYIECSRTYVSIQKRYVRTWREL